MNEEVLKDLYDRAVSQGYTKSIEEFQKLLNNNNDVLNDNYNHVKGQGYEKSIEDFSTLVGVKKKDESDSISQEVVTESTTPTGQEEAMSSDGFDTNLEGKPSDLTPPEISISEKSVQTDPITLDFSNAKFEQGEKDTALERTFGKNVVTDFFGDLYRAGAAGQAQGGSVDESLELFAKGSDVSDEDIQDFIAAQERMQASGESDEMRDFQKIYQADGGGILGFIKGVAANPTVVPQLFVSSVSAMLTPAVLAGTSAGAGAGALAGSATLTPFGVGAGAIAGAMGGAGTTLETGLTYSELLQEQLEGKPMTNENIRAVLEDEEAMDNIRLKAVGRGLTIGAVDAAFGGMASKLTTSVAKSTGRKMLAATAGGATEAVGGSVGEIAGRVVAGQDMDVAEVLFEGVAGTATAPLTVGYGLYKSPKYKINGTGNDAKVSGPMMAKFLRDSTPEQLLNADVSIENDSELQAIYDEKFKEATVKNDILKVDPEINTPTLDAITKLQIELDNLKSNDTQPAKDRAIKIKEEIKNLQDNPLTEEIDAIQEPSTKTVDVQEQTGVSETVGERDTEVIETATETTQEVQESDVDTQTKVDGEPKFRVEGLEVEDQNISEVVEEMNQMDESEKNFTVPTEDKSTTEVNPIKESESTTTISQEELAELGFKTEDDVVKPISFFDGIPMITAISDILASGKIKDAIGGIMNVDGGLMYNLFGKNKKAAWAGVDKTKSKTQYDNAVKLYNENKNLFKKLWADGKLPNGHVPMAVIRMGNTAVNSNEASFRFIAPEIKAQPLENQKKAFNDVLNLFTKTQDKAKAKSVSEIINFINKNNINDLGTFFDAITEDAKSRAKGNIKDTLSLDSRKAIFDTIISPEGTLNNSKPFIESLYGGDKKKSNMFTADFIYKGIGEPSMMKTKKGDVVSIVGVDVLNGGVIDVEHNNYGTGPKGQLIALIKNPTNAINLFPTWRAKASRIFKKNKAGKAPDAAQVSRETMGTAASDVAFQGDAPNAKMSNLDILIGKLKFAFPKVNVSTSQVEFDAVMNQPGVRTKESNGKVILGLTKDGQIYINPSFDSLATPIHEFGHIWTDFLRSDASGKKGTALLARGLKLVEGTEALKSAIEKYGDTNLAREEALVELMATKGENIVNAAQKSKFKEWMNATFKYIQEKFTTSKDLKIEDIETLTLEEFINTGIADLFSGKPIDAKSKTKFDAKTEAQSSKARFELGKKTKSIIDKLLSKYEKTGKRGKTFKQQISSAVAVLKTTPEYKKMTDVQRDAAVRELKKRMGEKQVSSPSVKRVLGIKKSDQITLSAADGIIQSIRDAIRGGKDMKKFILEAEKNLADEVNKLVKKGNITNNQAQRILKRFASTDVTSEAQVDRFVDYMENVYNKSEDKYKKSIVNDIVKKIKDNAKKVVTASNKVKAKSFDPETQQFFEAMNEVISQVLKKESFEAIKNKVFPDIDSIIGKDFESLSPKEKKQLYAFESYEAVKDINDMSLEQVESLLEDIKLGEKTGRAKLKERRDAFRAEVAEKKKQADKDIKDGDPELFNEDGTLKGPEQLRQDKAAIESKIWDKGLGKVIADYVGVFDLNNLKKSILGFKNSLTHLGTLTNGLDKTGTFFTDNIYKPLNRAVSNYTKGLQTQRKKMDSIAKSIEGINSYNDIKEKLLSGVHVFTGLKENGKPIKESRFSANQLMRIYALSKNEVQREKLKKQGFTDEKMQEIEKILGKEVTEFADKVVEYLSTEYFEETNKVYTEVNDVNLNFVDNYFPTQTVQQQTNSKMLEDGDFSGLFNAESAPALKERGDVKGEVALDGTFTDVLDGHFNAIEKFKSYAPTVRLMASVMNIPSVRVLLEQAGLTKAVKNAINMDVNPNSYQNIIEPSILDTLATKYTSFALAFKLVQIAKQATSFINAFEDYSYRKDGKSSKGLDAVMFMVDAADLIINLKSNIKRAWEMSPMLQERLLQGLEGDVYSLETGSMVYKQGNKTPVSKIKQRLKTLAAAPTVIGDVLGVMGYMINYNRDIKNGMDPQQAMEKFEDYNATQQTRRGTEKIPLQMAKSPYVRFFTMFGSTLFLQMNKVMQSATNISRAVKGKKPLTKKDTRALLLNLGVANVLFAVTANMAKLIKGEDEDREEVMQTLTEAMLGVNQLYKVPIMGSAIEEIANKAKGVGSKPVDDIVNPLGSVVQKISKMSKGVDKGEYTKVVGNTVRGLTELAIGVQADPFIGLAKAFTGDFSDETIYDVLGISSSYRPKGKTAKQIKEDKLGQYNNETEMKRYNKALWNKTFGPESEGYEEREAEKKNKALEKKEKLKKRDEEFNFTPKKKSKRGSNRSRSRSSKRGKGRGGIR